MNKIITAAAIALSLMSTHAFASDMAGQGSNAAGYGKSTIACRFCASNGLSLNGVNFNGLTFNGLTFNGLGWNGVNFNGLTYNGVNFNGTALNGTASHQTARSVCVRSEGTCDLAGGFVIRTVTLSDGTTIAVR